MHNLESAVIALAVPQDISTEVLIEKYAKGKETSIAEVHARVARALAEVEPAKQRKQQGETFLWAMEHGFIPAGRVASAAGAGLQSTLINCFVQPVGDSITQTVDGKPGIYTALAQAAETMRRGGGVGYNFSAIRPKGALVKGTGSSASGPISYMNVFDKSCETVESAGARRGAQMAVLDVDHPDLLDFITAKQERGQLNNFNMSVGISDAFMQAVEAGTTFDLVHVAEPNAQIKAKEGVVRPRADGKWVYRTVQAREVWDLIMQSTYAAAEPGVLYMDRINAENNLAYCEKIAATNPCGEQPLPDYGCCCLGSLNLTAYVTDPFKAAASFDFDLMAQVTKVAVRMLDNVLIATLWPLAEQAQEAANKRRLGLGFTGLGDALIMLGVRYDSEAGRELAARIACTLRDAAYASSVDLAKERGAFPLFDAERYLAGGFASRLPEALKDQIRAHGIRNSHLTSIAPTGTISLAFADNASNGIEPAFSWFYERLKRMPDGSKKAYTVEDHAYRVYRALGHDTRKLPPAFVSALEIAAIDHMLMVACVAPYVDAAISKTVNVPQDYPYADFKNLYMEAWRKGLKGITTYRPNSVLGAVLSLPTTATAAPVAAAIEPAMTLSEQDKRMVLTEVALSPPLASLRWPSRPGLPAGASGWVSDTISSPQGDFAVLVSDQGGVPFEVWVLGGQPPRGLDAIAKTLSADMRADDKGWLRKKFSILAHAFGDPFTMPMPPHGTPLQVPSATAALARLIEWRYGELGALDVSDSGADEPTPVLNALFAAEEPRTGTDGTLAWVADIRNPSTGDDFVLMLKELQMPDGSRRPYSMWLTGGHPRALDGLCKLLSLDMRVIDPAWIGMKLRKLLNYAEPRGDFLARVPGSEKQASYPSTVAYVAQLVIHRYAMLGILTKEGLPINAMGVVMAEPTHAAVASVILAGKPCGECGNRSVIKKDGCDFCTACGAIGSCG